MLKNIFLFTGQEKYLLDAELKRRKDGFIEKFGKDTIFLFNSENFAVGTINECIFGWWLFFSKKLIIINWIPLDTDISNKINNSVSEIFIEDFLKKKWVIPDEVLLIFISYKADKRWKMYKFLAENGNLKDFDNLKESDYKSFIKENLKNISSDSETTDYLLLKVWNNLYRLSSEVEKINLFCEKNKISKLTNEIIDNVVFGSSDINSFELFDHFFTDKNRVIKIIESNQASWTDRNQYIGMLYRWFKLYIFLVNFHQKWIKDAKYIAQSIKYHPFAIMKNMKNIEKIVDNYENIKKIYKNLIQIDAGIKSWKYPDSYFWLGVKKSIYENM